MKNLILLMLMFGFTLSSAQNLIRNGGFESNYSPPWWTGQHYLCDYWGNSSIWGSPDYYHMEGSGDAQLPHNYASTVTPFEGAAVMGIFLYELHSSTPDFREYLNQELEEPLVIGQHYQLSFYVTTGNGPVTHGGYGCDRFSVAFSTRQLFQALEDNKYLIDFEPQYTYEGILYNNNWQLITHDFVADSAYQHITFGSFVNDSIQQIQLFDEPSESGGVNYYLDKISLQSTTSIQEQISLNNDVAITPNPVLDDCIISFDRFGVESIYVLDLNGRVMYQEKSYKAEKTIQLSLNLFPGLYIVQLRGVNGEVATKKFVKL